MAHKNGTRMQRAEEMVEQWRRMRRSAAAQSNAEDPVMKRIRERREKIFRRIGELDDSVKLIREDRER